MVVSGTIDMGSIPVEATLKFNTKSRLNLYCFWFKRLFIYLSTEDAMYFSFLENVCIYFHNLVFAILDAILSVISRSSSVLRFRNYRNNGHKRVMIKC